jgi:hypothetical protein
MRRWLTILLLVLMPLQLGWAALGSYCEHESGEQNHLGHHACQHKAGAGSEDEPEPGQGPDADCSTCFSASMTPGVSGVFDACSHGAGYDELAFSATPIARPVSPPDRPDWLRLA